MSKRTPSKSKKSGSIFTHSKKQQKKNLCGFNRCSDKLPPIIDQTCQYLEKKALQHEGLFRISGSQETVRHIKDKFDKGKKVDLSKELNPNTIAGVLKLFFTELPNPVLTYELYPALMAAITINNDELQLLCLRKVIDAMPTGNRAVIDRVCAMFQTIASFEEENKMSAKNIALVVNPAMFRDPDDSINAFVQTGRLRVKLVEKLIIHHKALFLSKKEEIEEQSKRITSGLDPEIRQQLDNFMQLLQQNSILLASALMNEGETELTVHFDLVNSSPHVAHRTESLTEKLEATVIESESKDAFEINIEKATPRSTTPRSTKSTPRSTPGTTPRDVVLEKDEIAKIQIDIRNAEINGRVLSASNSDDSDINDDSQDSSEERDELEETLEICDSPEIPKKLHPQIVFQIESNMAPNVPVRNKVPIDIKLRNNVRTKQLMWG